MGKKEENHKKVEGKQSSATTMISVDAKWKVFSVKLKLQRELLEKKY